MTSKRLLQSNSWLRVAVILQELYPEEAENLSIYKEVFEKLLFMDVENSDITIEVVQQKDDFDGEEYLDVSGTYKNPKTEEEKFSQALELTPWNKWLGMEISQDGIIQFSELEIIAHCLHEMTFMGFEEEEIQNELSRIQGTIEEYKTMTDEEKDARTTSMDELLKNLENEDDVQNESWS